MEKIDFILTWVDGSDPEWLQSRAAYAQDTFNTRVSAQYRDWGTLPYWFRAVEKYAPWVNRIHFVTCGHRPEWLNISHPKLHLVRHCEYMPASYLPTFSANPIELNLHRIEGLEEHFVYFNDDTFLTAPVTEEFFFRNGLPCDCAEMACLIPSIREETITHILFNDLCLVNTHFCKRETMRRHLRKWLNLQYGVGFLRNLYYLPIGKFSGFIDPHLPNAYLKSTFQEVWQAEPEYLDEVCKNRFRTDGDVNQYIMRYWQLASGCFAPRSPKVGACFTVGGNEGPLERAFLDNTLQMVCVNDDPQLEDITEAKKRLLQILEQAFPEKSSFEV